MMRFTTAAFCLLLSVAVPVSAQSLPTGFTDDLVVSGIPSVCGIAFAPDGRLFATSRLNFQVWCCLTTGAKQSIGSVPNGMLNPSSERGLLGIVVDPNFPASPYIYVHYSRVGGMAVSRFTLTGDLNNPASTNLALGARYDILLGLPDNAFNHNGGTVRFGTDGMLYASFGDDASSCTAQNIGDGRGEILRMDVGGLPAGAGGPPSPASITPAGNPFISGGAWASLVWTYGLRNPFRFNIDADGPNATNSMYIGDVGQNAWEEVDELPFSSPPTDRNFGWPWKEANANYFGCGGGAPATVAPIVAISQSTGAFSIMSMPRYRNIPGGTFSFGSSYEGDLFYVDYYLGVIMRREWSGTSWMPAPPAPGQPAAGWATGYGGLTDAIIGPDGAIYYARHTTSQIRRIKSDANAPQLSVVSGNNQVGNQGQILPLPLRVQVLTQGVPQAGLPVTFSPNLGTVGPQPVMTDANGFAETTYTLDPVTGNAPVITANVTGGVPATFNATWRGLFINYLSSVNLAIFQMRHSQANSPITVAYDLPRPNPVVSMPFGWEPLWLDFVTPSPYFGVLADGMGLFGPVTPNSTTSASALWSQVFSNLPPLGGLTLAFQGYAVDTSLFPSSSAVVISDRIDVTFN